MRDAAAQGFRICAARGFRDCAAHGLAPPGTQGLIFFAVRPGWAVEGTVPAIRATASPPKISSAAGITMFLYKAGFSSMAYDKEPPNEKRIRGVLLPVFDLARQSDGPRIMRRAIPVVPQAAEQE